MDRIALTAKGSNVMAMLTWLETTPPALWIAESGSLWAYPLVLTLHTVGLAMLVGSSAAVSLRLLGVASAVPLAALAPVFRIIWAGFAVNAPSGALLFMSAATTKGVQVIFWIKLATIAAGLVIMRRLERRGFTGVPGDAASASTRRLAALALVAWTVAIVTGRLMAYL